MSQEKSLHPYIGSIPNHRPYCFLRWEEAEDEHGFLRYMDRYHNSALPEKYRLDGTWGYRFNSLGYRGEEYNPDAKLHLFVCGCSYTYGMGIQWHQTFPYVFKESWAKSQGIQPEAINLLNFAQQAASNDYITRTVLSQCFRVKPDLLLVQFTTKERYEYLDERGAQNVGPWLENEASQNYYRFYTEQMGLLNTIKNILLVQTFCKLHNIPYLFSVFHHAELTNPDFLTDPIVASYYEQLDMKYISPFSLIDFRCDVGRMGHHPGPLSNLRFGRKLFYHFGKVFAKT